MTRDALRSVHTCAEMPVERHGTAGPAWIYIPSSGGDESEFRVYGMGSVCRPWIEAGRLQLFTIDGWARHSLWNPRLDGRGRIRAYAAYERYVKDELLPWVVDRSGDERPFLLGCSYGAFVAANVLFKHPERTAGACGLGGVYGMWHRLDGHHDDDVYFHTPLEFLPRLEDAGTLEAIRRGAGLALYAAQDDEWRTSSTRMAAVLRDKDLPHTLDLWPSPASHHESWWRRQLAVFLETRL